MKRRNKRPPLTKTFKSLDKDSMHVLASDIRAQILSACLCNGGHLSSNLGVVDLTVSLIKNFNIDTNDILFDVGHQAYTYKLLTGRDISKIRHTNGVSPFNLKEESKYDVYSNGHAGDSISTAIGLAIAKNSEFDPSYTICVIGDASIENGLSLEALDFISSHKNINNLIIVLNDNGMAISKNVGTISSKFTLLRNSRFYFRMSSYLGKKMSKYKFTWKLFLRLRALKDRFKNMVIKPTIFEACGIKYIGPYDGYDFDSLDLAFTKAKVLSHKQPVIVHIMTKKGFGYPLAMQDENGEYHGVSKDFDDEYKKAKINFTNLKAKLIERPMKNNENIYLITPAMEKGSGLENLFKQFPNRCIDTGISEEHAVVLASGLALGNKEPIVDIYSTFLQRGYDEIIENISRNNLKVLFFVERAGLVGEDGSSHHGIYDVAFLKSIPNCSVYMPFNNDSLLYCYNEFVNSQQSYFIRLPKDIPCFETSQYVIKNDVAIFNKNNNKSLVLGVSVMGELLVERFINQDMDTAVLLNLLPDNNILMKLDLLSYQNIYFYDPYSISDGTNSVLSEYLIKNDFRGKYYSFTLEKKFVTFGQIKDLYKQNELDVETIYNKIALKELKIDNI